MDGENEAKEQAEGQSDAINKIDELKAELARQLEIADEARKNIRKTMQELAKEEISVVISSEVAINASRKMGPMDDVFFNKMGEDLAAIEEAISTFLGMNVTVKYSIPQYTITGIGTRGVRLDAFASAVPEVVVTVELGEDCILGPRGALVDIEVQKSNDDDHEFRVYYNGASIIVNNTPKGTKKFGDIPRAVVIYISDFDIFGEGEMFYEVHKTIKKSGTPRRSPVTEIYINTVNEDRSNDRMGRIADLMKVFKDPELYDFDRFPRFSQRKWDLKKTQKGVMEVSKELQKIIDDEKAESERKGRAEGRAEERKDLTGLMSFLASNGRSEDIIKAWQDEGFLNKLLIDFRGGLMTAR